MNQQCAEPSSIDRIEDHPPVLDSYVIDKEIGRGAHGVVYLGHNRQEPRHLLALKVIRNRGNLDRLLIEPEILRRLDHPNIVRPHETRVVGDQIIMAMDFIDGTDLGTLLESGPMSPDEVTQMLLQLGSALAHAHSRSVIHCDIKPSNIRVTGSPGNRTYVLTDFGVSRVAGGMQTRPRVAGTYLYMAPEQIRGRSSVQSDLWGLGIVAVTALMGQPPFRGNLGSLIRSINYDPLPPLEDVAGPHLARILTKLLEKSLADRMGSANDLLEQLKDAKPKQLFALPGDSSRSANPAPGQPWEAMTRKTLHKNKQLFWAGAILFVVAGGLIGSALELMAALCLWQWCAARGETPSGKTKLRRWLWIPGLLALFLGAAADVQWETWLASFPESSWQHLLSSSIVSLLITAPGALLAGYAFGKTRMLSRQLALRNGLGSVHGAAKGVSPILLSLVRVYPGDTNLHLRCIEALMNEDRVEEAVVEAQVVLATDPYNFDASLHLAAGFYALGFQEDCVRICNGYLAISPVSFEFQELRKQAQGAAVTAPEQNVPSENALTL